MKFIVRLLFIFGSVVHACRDTIDARLLPDPLPRSNNPKNRKFRIVTVGDSLTMGACASNFLKTSWPPVLQNLLN